jgi:hypothetical protein
VEAKVLKVLKEQGYGGTPQRRHRHWCVITGVRTLALLQALQLLQRPMRLNTVPKSASRLFSQHCSPTA